MKPVLSTALVCALSMFAVTALAQPVITPTQKSEIAPPRATTLILTPVPFAPRSLADRTQRVMSLGGPAAQLAAPFSVTVAQPKVEGRGLLRGDAVNFRNGYLEMTSPSRLLVSLTVKAQERYLVDCQVFTPGTNPAGFTYRALGMSQTPEAPKAAIMGTGLVSFLTPVFSQPATVVYEVSGPSYWGVPGCEVTPLK